MTITGSTSKRFAVLAGLALAASAGACSTVSPDEMDAGLAALRTDMMNEMSSGDDRVSQELGGRLGTVEQRIAALESDLQEMERDFEITVQRLEDELRFDVPVYFGFDDATVEEEDQAVLDRFGSVAQKYYPDALLTIEGFTDQSGTEAYNLDLGQRRADAVRSYLVNNTMLAGERVRSVSYGENTARLVRPDDVGPGTPGWENRRVVLVIDHDGVAPMMSDEDATQP